MAGTRIARNHGGLAAGLKVLGAALFLGLACDPAAQSIHRDGIDALLAEGEITKAEKSLEQALKSGQDLTYLDSLYALKNLGVLYANQPKKQAKGDTLFIRLLGLDPFASLHDTYASNTIIARFKKIRKGYQERIGGKALVPTLAVFDVLADAKRLTEEERVTLTHQAIAELQRITIFHTLDRSIISESLQRMRKASQSCEERSCRLDMARRLTAEKMAQIEIGRLDTNWTVHITLIDVETGQTSSSVRKNFAYGDLLRLASEGLKEMAEALQQEEAAWFNLTLNPSNASLSVDGSPTISLTSRLPLNPGKHTLCAQSPGYISQCKEFTVKKNDAVTYAFILKPQGGREEPSSSARMESEFIEEEYTGMGGSDAPPSRIVWWALGGMGALAVVLLLVLNTKD
jgi:hypothetical protein